MHRLVHTSISCGVRELVGLSDGTPRELIQHVAHARFNRREQFSVVLFSDSTRRGAGLRLAAFIRANHLGTLKATSAHINPNTEREIKVWMWEIDYRTLETGPSVSQRTREWDAEDAAHDIRPQYGA